MNVPDSVFSVSKKKVPEKRKREFFEKELRAGKQKTFKGLKDLKKAIQTKTDSLADIQRLAKKVRKANTKINAGRQRVIYAKKQLTKIKTKKYWK